MAKRNNISHIKEIIEGSINNREIRGNFKILLLKKAWKSIIGEKLYLHTAPQKILKNNLYIKCAHQGWIQTLYFYKSEILSNITKYYMDEIQIKDLVFVLGKINKDDFADNANNLYENKNDIKHENMMKNDNLEDLLKEYFKICDNKTSKTIT